jgi:hypothetical protein
MEGDRMIAKLVAFWNGLPDKTKQWLKGAEVAVATAVVTSYVAAPASDFHSKKGIAEFSAGVGAAAYGALRLYMAQSPIPVLVKQTEQSETTTVGDVSKTTSTIETVTQGGATDDIHTSGNITIVNSGPTSVVNDLADVPSTPSVTNVHSTFATPGSNVVELQPKKQGDTK